MTKRIAWHHHRHNAEWNSSHYSARCRHTCALQGRPGQARQHQRAIRAPQHGEGSCLAAAQCTHAAARIAAVTLGGHSRQPLHQPPHQGKPTGGKAAPTTTVPNSAARYSADGITSNAEPGHKEQLRKPTLPLVPPRVHRRPAAPPAQHRKWRGGDIVLECQAHSSQRQPPMPTVMWPAGPEWLPPVPPCTAPCAWQGHASTRA